jgi:hypothetical protein
MKSYLYATTILRQLPLFLSVPLNLFATEQTNLKHISGIYESRIIVHC